MRAPQKYFVRDVRGSHVLIDMASKLEPNDEFQVYHRMHLSLAEALAAPEHPSQWQFRKFGFMRDEKWREAPYRDNVQALEEKFDCFLMAPAASTSNVLEVRRREVSALGDAKLVRSERHAYTGAWYVSEPCEHAGVAAFKAFGKEGSDDTYTFELIAMGTGEGVDEPSIL